MEKATDYLSEKFSVYLHNGDPLGTNSKKVPKPAFFGVNEFDKAALDALKGWDGSQNYKENRAKNLGLAPNSKDLVAMTTMTEYYNGVQDPNISSYVYSGTNLYSSGLYTSDGHYDPNAKDANLGTYPVLEALLKD